jgi:hypothetical protein
MTRPILFSGPMVRTILEGRKTQTRRVIKPQLKDCPWVADGCPYGQPGDLLWVREAWNYFGGNEYLYQQDKESVSYRADPPVTQIHGDKWRPSIHMPRWASRLTLRITDVRVQRVQEISEGDAVAEGVKACIAGQDEHGPVKTYRTGFVRVWQEINAKRGYSWESNPWVWSITFEPSPKQEGK